MSTKKLSLVITLLSVFISSEALSAAAVITANALNKDNQFINSSQLMPYNDGFVQF